MHAIFEWDPHKAEVNLRKHGIQFETARLALADFAAFYERDQSAGGEDRFRVICRHGDIFLVVVITQYESENMEITRIISARTATAGERKKYESENG